MKNIVAVLLNRWILGGLAVLLLCLAIWLIGDAIAIFDRRPLETASARFTLIGITIFLWLALELLRLWRIRRANQRMLQDLAGSAEDAATSARSAQEVATLNRRFEEAMLVLRKARFKGRGGQKQYLYELPWYVFIGAPGSGKTTALVNSGLKFPFEKAGGEQSIKGVGGTRNCDWWFTDEAVLLDTAGRYTTQDSEERVDSSAWLGFLDLLKRFRPRQPLNGAIITVSISDMLSQSESEREQYARHVSQRVQELYERLGLRFPVYLMVTKVDLLAGFMEFFGDMSREQRSQVWGMTFPLTAAGETKDFAQLFAAEFASLEQRLNAKVLSRLHDERDLQRRAIAYNFPQQFSAMGPQLREFVAKAFGGSRYSEQVMLRGIYFTSGTQEGSPIDRVLGTLARSFKLERKILPPAISSGKSFFIQRLLRDVLFAEAGLGGANESKERQLKWLMAGAYGVTALVTVGLLVAWTLSYFNNSSLIADARTRVAAAKPKLDAVQSAQANDVAAVIPVLNELRDLPSGYASRNQPVSLAYEWGLYQGDSIGERSMGAYRRALGEVLLPRASLRLEEILARPRDAEQLYVALRGYLMLHSDKYLNPPDLARLLLATWAGSLQRDGVEAVAALDGHLNAALEVRPIQNPSSRNDALVADARRRLATMPLADRIYARLKGEFSGNAQVPPFRISEAAGPGAAQVFTRASGQPLTAGIEGLFTREGYLKIFRTESERLAKDLSQEESWVLADSGATGARALDAAKLMADIRERYAQDYEKQWEALLTDIRLPASTGLAQTAEHAKILSAPDSPLKRLLMTAAKELSLAPAENPVKGAIEGVAKGAVQEALNSLRYGKLLGDAGAQAVGQPAGPSPEQRLEARFLPLRNLVAQQGAAGAAPIDAVTQLLSELYTQLRAAQESLQRGDVSTPLGALGTRLKTEADRYPEPVRSIMRDLAQRSTGQATGVAQQNIQRAVSDAGSFCGKAVAGKYPFVKAASADVLLDDFNKVFAPNGQLDEFFTKNLAQFIETPTGRDWRARPGMESAAPPLSTIREYQRAAVIRDSFFRAGSQAQVVVDVRLSSLSGASDLTIEDDGKSNKLTPGAVARLQWPNTTPGTGAKIAVPGAPVIAYEGPWALFRLFDRGTPQPGARTGTVRLAFAPDPGHPFTLELQLTSVNNPFQIRELQDFHCPGQR